MDRWCVRDFVRGNTHVVLFHMYSCTQLSSVAIVMPSHHEATHLLH